MTSLKNIDKNINNIEHSCKRLTKEYFPNCVI